jgi:hypothetical protein
MIFHIPWTFVHLPTKVFFHIYSLHYKQVDVFHFFIIHNCKWTISPKMTTMRRPQTCNSQIFSSKWPLTKRTSHKFSFTNLAQNIKLNLLVHMNWSKKNPNSLHFWKFYLNPKISIDSSLEDFVTKLKLGEARLSINENSNKARTWDFKFFVARLERMYIIIGGWISLLWKILEEIGRCLHLELMGNLHGLYTPQLRNNK